MLPSRFKEKSLQNHVSTVSSMEAKKSKSRNCMHKVLRYSQCHRSKTP